MVPDDLGVPLQMSAFQTRVCSPLSSTFDVLGNIKLVAEFVVALVPFPYGSSEAEKAHELFRWSYDVFVFFFFFPYS